MADREIGAASGVRLPAVAALLAGSVLLSRLLGYVREMVLAWELGVSGQVDAYRAAFQIPDLLNYFLAGGAFSIAFIPLYQSIRSRRGDAAAQELFASVLGTLTAAAVGVTALLWWYAEPLIDLQFAGFDESTRALTVRLTRIVLPAQIFFVAGGILRAILMSHGHFGSQALAPLLYNLGIIACGVVLAPSLGAEGFAWGVLLGAVVGNLVVPAAEISRVPDLPVRLRIRFGADVRAYLRMAAPLMLGITLVTADEWYDRWFGSRLGEGVVSVLAYARYLMQLPVAVVGQALATAALPVLSRLWSEGRRTELDALVLSTLRVGLGLALLAAAASAVLAEPLVSVVYEHGSFGEADAQRVGVLLGIFAFAVPAWVTQQIALRAFYARGQMWTPMLLGTAVAAAAIPLYLRLGADRGAEGLALAGVVAMSVNAALTVTLARILHGGPRIGPLLATAGRVSLVAAGAAAGCAWVAPLGREAGAPAELAIGAGAFAAISLVGVMFLGDADLRGALVGRARHYARTLGWGRANPPPK